MFFLYKNNFLQKINEIKNEFKIISWASKQEITQSILMVIVLVVLTCFCLWIIDSILVYAISRLI